MDVFGKGTDEPSRPLLPPGTCWICDQSPTQEVTKVIDTRRNARPGGPTVHESVRKYICEDCAREMGKAVGMASPEEVQQRANEQADDCRLIHELKTELEELKASQVKVVPTSALEEIIRAELASLLSRPTGTKRAPATPPSE